MHGAARPGARISMGAAVLDGWTGRLALTVLAAEHWIPPPKPDALVMEAGPEAAADEPAGRRRKNVQQSELQLGGASDRGRFRDVAPTIVEGADLDVPVFIRRGIRIPS